ncbi:MAG TPA: hypothetical protein VLC48_07425 [Gemmatimonadota bacterium]|nr:hypothetical protein [Gemmatimonadota bacterium]
MAEPDHAAQTSAPEGDGRGHAEEMDRHAASLRETIGEVLDYIKSQVKLRHSLYYENQHVVDRVAAALTEP